MDRQETDKAIEYSFGKDPIVLPDDRYLEHKGQKYLNNQGWLERELGGRNMLDKLNEEFEIEKEAYEITSMEEALLTFEQIFDEQSKIKNLKDKIKQTKNFYENQIRYEEFKIDSLKNALLAYHEKQMMADPKAKIKSPFGNFVNHKEKLDFELDEEKLIKKYNGTDLVKTESTLYKGDLKKRLSVIGNKVIDTETGEVIDGANPVTKPAYVSVSIRKPKEDE